MLATASVEVTEQVSCPPEEVTEGGVVFCETVTTDGKDGQPADVTTSVYVPGWLTVAEAEVPPDKIPGPLQE